MVKHMTTPIHVTNIPRHRSPPNAYLPKLPQECRSNAHFASAFRLRFLALNGSVVLVTDTDTV